MAYDNTKSHKIQITDTFLEKRQGVEFPKPFKG